MATTRTPGITVLADGRRFIDKRYLGVRIGLRVGAVTQEQAEERLQIEIARVQCEPLERRTRAGPLPFVTRVMLHSRAVSAVSASSGMSHFISRTSEISSRTKFMIRRWSPS